jgi:hypothetical protein
MHQHPLHTRLPLTVPTAPPMPKALRLEVITAERSLDRAQALDMAHSTMSPRSQWLEHTHCAVPHAYVPVTDRAWGTAADGACGPPASTKCGHLPLHSFFSVAVALRKLGIASPPLDGTVVGAYKTASGARVSDESSCAPQQAIHLGRGNVAADDSAASAALSSGRTSVSHGASVKDRRTCAWAPLVDSQEEEDGVTSNWAHLGKPRSSNIGTVQPICWGLTSCTAGTEVQVPWNSYGVRNIISEGVDPALQLASLSASTQIMDGDVFSVMPLPGVAAPEAGITSSPEWSTPGYGSGGA